MPRVVHLDKEADATNGEADEHTFAEIQIFQYAGHCLKTKTKTPEIHRPVQDIAPEQGEPQRQGSDDI